MTKCGRKSCFGTVGVTGLPARLSRADNSRVIIGREKSEGRIKISKITPLKAEQGHSPASREGRILHTYIGEKDWPEQITQFMCQAPDLKLRSSFVDGNALAIFGRPSAQTCPSLSGVFGRPAAFHIAAYTILGVRAPRAVRTSLTNAYASSTSSFGCILFRLLLTRADRFCDFHGRSRAGHCRLIAALTKLDSIGAPRRFSWSRH
jgi:hypothetical protein